MGKEVSKMAVARKIGGMERLKGDKGDIWHPLLFL